ncbi:MAG TPA: hypothetical protein VFC18_20205 [Burkholderiales bacterium]|nr:hypothetical protein [Burkholderiales bacterium]
MITRTAIAFAAALALGSAAFAAEEHDHHGRSEAKLVLNHGKKWQTDAPLRKGMENIRAALASGKKYPAIGERVNAEIAYIVQNCKLPEDADAQLHIVIAELMAGAEAMQGEGAREGAARVARALDAYGEFFDHPGWRKG